MDRDDDQQQAELHAELELMTIAALARCATAGADQDDIQFLAAQLGVGDWFRQEQSRTRLG